MQHIFVEGPDGGGKSTLVQKLTVDLWTFGVHTGSAPKSRDEMEARFDWLTEVTSAPLSRGFVFDRCPFVCEMVYPPVVERDHYFSRDDCLDRAVQTNAVFVYCRRPTQDMREAISQELKGHKSPEHTEQVIRGYEDLVNNYDRSIRMLELTGARVLHYDWGISSYDYLKTELLACVA